MSEMINWYNYYMRQVSNPDLTLDQQVSYYKAAQAVLGNIRKEVEADENPCG